VTPSWHERYKGRSVLAAIGIAISVALMVLLANIIESAQLGATRGLRAMGSHTLVIAPNSQLRLRARLRRPLGIPDASAIRRRVRGVDDVTPLYSLQGTTQYRGLRRVVNIVGTVPGLEDTQGLKINTGRFILDVEVWTAQHVLVIGRSVADALGVEEIGEYVLVSGRSFRVIGIASALRRIGDTPNVDDSVFMPASVAEQIYGSSVASSIILVRASHTREVGQVADDVRRTLRASRALGAEDDDDFIIQSQTELVASIETVTRAAERILLGLVAFALLVAVIGVLNSVLTSVLERTPEIGLKRAVGATRAEIQLEVVRESLSIAIAGAAAGVTLGIVLAAGISASLDWPVVTQWNTVFLAMSCALMFTLIASLWPAIRAGRLDPVAALHHE
jgi:putative ABC transport system permease protein